MGGYALAATRRRQQSQRNGYAPTVRGSVPERPVLDWQ
jgi:hypothetical protein